MKRLCILLVAISTSVIAQKQKISLDDIWTNGTFRTERLNAFHSLKNADHYTLLNVDREQGTSSLDKYDYQSLEKIATVVDSKNLSEIDAIESYEFSKDESKLLLGLETERIYRRSSRAKFYVYDINSKELKLISCLICWGAAFLSFFFQITSRAR